MSFDHLKLVIVGDILFPKNRQMNLNIIKVIASFIGVVGSEFVAGYRVDERVNAIPLRHQAMLSYGHGCMRRT